MMNSNVFNRSIATLAILAIGTVCIRAQMPARRTPSFSSASGDSSTVTPLSSGPSVKGSGSAGMIPKWLDSNSLGDSIITESGGKIGLGTNNPTSTLTVAGSTNTLIGVIDVSDSGAGFALHARTTNGFAAMRALHQGTVGFGVEAIGPIGLFAHTGAGGYNAVFALNNSADEAAIYANNLDPTGMAIEAEAPIGIKGRSSHAGGVGVLGVAGLGAFAGKFMGNVEIVPQFGSAGDLFVAGNLTKGGGSFKIDHPLDPENKYLYHSFVESPDMMNIYNGNVTTDANGDAVITLPEWFEALNKDFRYQLTVVGVFAQAIVAEKVKGNRFAIKTSAPNVEVSWQVTGVRQDAWANRHRIPTEEIKSEKERGSYLHPELFNQPEDKGVEWALHPEMMRRVKQTREQTKPKAQTHNQ